jgi:hypothetical protein
VSAWKKWLLGAAALAVNVAVSAISGYSAALSVPVQSQFAVLDVEALAKRVDVNSPSYKDDAKKLAERTSEVTQRLVEANILVLDKAHVLGVPEDAIIRIDSNAP